jgi:hypothetical protein
MFQQLCNADQLKKLARLLLKQEGKVNQELLRKKPKSKVLFLAKPPPIHFDELTFWAILDCMKNIKTS